MSDLAVQNRESEQEVMPSFDFLLERETERNTLLAEHRAWLKEIKRERPLPKTHYRVAVYIRYFNQTRYEDYLSAHKKQFLDTLRFSARFTNNFSCFRLTKSLFMW